MQLGQALPGAGAQTASVALGLAVPSEGLTGRGERPRITRAAERSWAGSGGAISSAGAQVEGWGGKEGVIEGWLAPVRRRLRRGLGAVGAASGPGR